MCKGHIANSRSECVVSSPPLYPRAVGKRKLGKKCRCCLFGPSSQFYVSLLISLLMTIVPRGLHTWTWTPPPLRPLAVAPCALPPRAGTGCQCAHRVTASPACRPQGRERHADAPSPAAGALESRVRRPPRQDLVRENTIVSDRASEQAVELLGKMRDGKRKETALERDCATGCLADADAPVRSLTGGEEIGPSTAGPY